MRSALLAVIMALQVVDGAWTPAGSKHGIAVAFRDAPGGVREVRATAELAVPAASVASLVCDFRHYGALVDGVRETRVIAGTVPADYEAYLRYAPRFVVVAARDVAVRVRTRTTPDGGGCEWASVEGREPPRAGIVRMPLLRGSWTIEPVGAARTRVVYQVAADPGGRLPGWLVRRGAVRALPDVILQVRRRLEPDAPPAGR